MVSTNSFQDAGARVAQFHRWRRQRAFDVIIIGLLILTACSGGAKYFQDAVNEATQEMVAKRYGSPHQTQSRSDGAEVWTYFERGSGTAGFGGQVRGGGCRAYVLTFDKQSVLRHWEQQPCQG